MLAWSLTATSAVLSAAARTSVRLRLLDWSSHAWSRNQNAWRTVSSWSTENQFKKMVEELPYPSNAPDTSIFEEDSAEYAVHEAHISQPLLSAAEREVSHAQQGACYPLYRSVKEGRYVDAEGIRTDLLNLGVHIQQDPVYALPALYALQTAGATDRIRLFAAWLSLVPAYSDPSPITTETQGHLQAISEFLLSELDNTDTEQSPDLRIGMAFAMICISKGYTEDLPFGCIRRIMQLASPEHATRFLQELITVHEHEAGANMADRSLLARLYGIAIRSQQWNGRHNLAVQFLKDAAARDITIDQRTITRLYKHLQARSLPMPTVLHEAYASIPAGDEGVLGLSFDEEDLREDVNVVTWLRNLRRTMNSRYPPSAKAIANFLLAYRSLKRTRAVELLYKRAMRRTITIRTWAMAEMVYHLHWRKPVYALAIYSSYFHLTAVPKLLVEETLERYASARGFKVEGIRKLDPTPTDTVYAWKALLDHHYSLNGAEVLYAHLMRKIADARMEISSGSDSSAVNEAGNDITWVRESSDAESSPAPREPQGSAMGKTAREDPDVLARLPDHSIPAVPNPRAMLSPYYFVPFIQALGKHSTPRRAARIFVDMASLGIEPDLYNYTALVGVYAAAGRTNRCLMILEQLDNMVVSAAVNEQTPPHMLRPNLATYTTVLRGLVDSRRLPGALQVKDRLVERFRYVYGTDWRTDQALDLLHALEQLDRTRGGVDGRIPPELLNP
ncbi:hypothetical protein OE88DRAFT_868832 [Heliocybe sulcata]|uniref:Pentacotripeptide-repeat region of PRORP domain-containing protein n=1 Tax=Heliocybe sulcata TaxID=5364 RepID=A0A5C3MNI5_9AGAM|nr:hypothetical protein OE88DRAFT_868832 [Heliocybe sulcata]